MTEKELRRLSRMDLLEMLLEQSKEVERLQQELAEARQQLEERRIMTEEAGSIAEAALRINRVFEAAQEAADQYLENIRRLSEEPEAPILKEGPAADEEVPGEQGRKGR